MFVQKYGLLLLVFRTQSNLDERAVVFFYPEKFFVTPSPGWKKLVFFIIFLWEKITKKFQRDNILWHGGYLLSKDQENMSACFRDITNLKFFF